MGVILGLFAAFFVVVYLVSILRRDTAESRAANIEDLEEIRSEMNSLRHRLENLEAIAASDTLEIALVDDETDNREDSAAARTGSAAKKQRSGQ